MVNADHVDVMVHFQYNGQPDPRLGQDWNLRAHLWTDSDREELPWVEVDIAAQRGSEPMMVHVPTGRRPFTTIYVQILHDWVADSDGTKRPVVVKGEARCGAEFSMAVLSKVPKLVHVDLHAPFAGDLVCGSVAMKLADFDTAHSAVGSRLGDTVKAAVGVTDALKAAIGCARKIAAVDGPLRGVVGMTPGMSSIETNDWNDRKTKMFGAVWTLNKPWAPDPPDFVDAFIGAAAARRGMSSAELGRLASAAAADISAKGKRHAPTQDTVKFAFLVAEGAHMVVMSSHYLTDMVDKNTKAAPWSSRKLEPVERMSAQLRLARAGDCEDCARDLCELFRSLVRSKPASDHPLHAAARLVAKCYVPLTILGFVDRPENSDPQYRTADNLNAHSWAMLIGTAGVEAMAERRSSKCSVELDMSVVLQVGGVPPPRPPLLGGRAAPQAPPC